MPVYGRPLCCTDTRAAASRVGYAHLDDNHNLLQTDFPVNKSPGLTAEIVWHGWDAVTRFGDALIPKKKT